MKRLSRPRIACLVAALGCSGLPLAAAADFAAAGEPWQVEEEVVLSPGAEQASQWESTLAGIYELALRNDKTLAAAQASYRAGQQDRRLGRAELLPAISAEYSYSDSNSESRGSQVFGGQQFISDTDTDREQETWSVSLQQPLFDVPAWFRFQRGNTLSEQAETRFSQAQQDLMVRTAEAYFAVLRARANLEAARAQEEAVAAQLEQAEQRFDVGLVAITDVHEARAAFDTARADRLSFEGDVEIAREALATLTGREHRDLWQLEEDFPVVDPTPADVGQWVEFAREHSVDLELARQDRKVAEHEARAALGEHLPKVNLSLSYQDSDADGTQENLTQNVTQAFASDQRDKQIAVNVSMPLFAGGRIDAGRRRADAQLEAQRQLLQATLREVTQGTRSSLISVRRNVARTNAREQAIVSSRSALEAAETGYEVGTRSIVDVLDSQRLLYSAVRDRANSVIDFVLDVIRLKRHAGLLTPADLLELNRWLEAPDQSGSNPMQLRGREE